MSCASRGEIESLFPFSDLRFATVGAPSQATVLLAARASGAGAVSLGASKRDAGPSLDSRSFLKMPLNHDAVSDDDAVADPPPLQFNPESRGAAAGARCESLRSNATSACSD